jgi:pimeloyl-ACP methyl ester carboxylesterase
VPKAMVGGVELAFIDVPAQGDPKGDILLVHGFASTHAVNWVNTSWVNTLTRAGYRVVAHDNRGHGASTKLYRPEDYDTALMAADSRGLLDHLGIRRAHVMGYSMGARITAMLALNHPERVRSVLLGGLGIHLVEGVGLPVGIADALEAPSVASLSDPTQRMFRAFAEQTGSDLRALAACIRGSRQTLTREEVGRIAAPVLVSVGTRDEIAGSPAGLAALMPDAQALDIPGRDHNLAVGDRVHKEGVLAFLEARSGG